MTLEERAQELGISIPNYAVKSPAGPPGMDGKPDPEYAYTWMIGWVRVRVNFLPNTDYDICVSFSDLVRFGYASYMLGSDFRLLQRYGSIKAPVTYLEFMEGSFVRLPDPGEHGYAEYNGRLPFSYERKEIYDLEQTVSRERMAAKSLMESFEKLQKELEKVKAKKRKLAGNIGRMLATSECADEKIRKKIRSLSLVG